MIDALIIVVTIAAFLFPVFSINAIRSESNETADKFKWLAGLCFAVIVCFLFMMLNR